MDENITLTKDTVYIMYGYNQRTGEYVKLCNFNLNGKIINDENTKDYTSSMDRPK